MISIIFSLKVMFIFFSVVFKIQIAAMSTGNHYILSYQAASFDLFIE